MYVDEPHDYMSKEGLFEQFKAQGDHSLAHGIDVEKTLYDIDMEDEMRLQQEEEEARAIILAELAEKKRIALEAERRLKEKKAEKDGELGEAKDGDIMAESGAGVDAGVDARVGARARVGA